MSWHSFADRLRRDCCACPTADRCRNKSARTARRARPAGEPAGRRWQNATVPYAARVAAVSRLRSNASVAANCMRNAVSIDRIRARSDASPPRSASMFAVQLLHQVELPPLLAGRKPLVLHDWESSACGSSSAVIDVQSPDTRRQKRRSTTAPQIAPAGRGTARRSPAGLAFSVPRP